MALTATIADNADGTGATVEITTSNDPDAITLERAAVSASAVGAYVDVTSGLTLGVGGASGIIEDVGYFSWRVSDGANTTTVYRPITEEGDSPHERILVMLNDLVASLEIPWLASNYIRGGSDETNIDFACTLLSVADTAEEDMGGSSLHNYVGYVTTLYMVERLPARSDLFRARLLSARKDIRTAIHNKHWDLRVPEVWNNIVRPAQVIAGESSTPERRQSILQVVSVSRELR